MMHGARSVHHILLSRMKKIPAIIFLLVSSGFLMASESAQQTLVRERVQELKQLNTALLENSGLLDSYNNKDVYVKARLVEKDNNSFALVLKEVSTSPIDDSERWREPLIPENSGNILYLQGKVSDKKNATGNFHLDIENVLPPEPKNKKQ